MRGWIVRKFSTRVLKKFFNFDGVMRILDLEKEKLNPCFATAEVMFIMVRSFQSCIPPHIMLNFLRSPNFQYENDCE